MRRTLTLLCFVASLALFGCSSEGDDDTGGNDAPDAGAVQPDAGDATDLAFMEACDPSDDLCATDLVCFNFNSRGPHCTHSCTTDDECADPSPGCNNMGVCKAP